jgi:acyl-CoA thioesterase-1
VALAFNAAADRLYLGGGAQPTNNAVWTVCLWVRTHATQSPSILVENDAAGSDINLALNAGVPGILNGYGFSWPVTLGPALTDDVWYFLAIRCNGTTGRITRGTEAISCTHATGTIPSQASAYRLNIGGTPSAFYPTADLAHCRAWNADLSDADLEAERQSATPVRTANLFGDWPLASDATKLVNNSIGGNLTANSTGPWSDVTGPSFGAAAVTGTSAVTLGAAASSAAGAVGAAGSSTSTLGGATSAASGTFTLATVSGTSATTLGGATSSASGTASSAGSLDWSTLMPLISRPGKPVFGTGTPAQMVDGKYGYVDGVADGAWACSGGSWVAVQVGAGPTQVLVALSNDNASGGSYLASVVQAYRIQVSSDSTNGSDGAWTTAVTVTGNPAYAREHLIAFTGRSWVKLMVDTCTGGQLDELNVWDATNGTPDTFAFLGDSITDGALRRHFYFGGGLLPSFQENVLENQPGHYPLQLNVGVTGQGAAYWAANIASALALYPDVRYWCVGVGMNDGASMPGQLTQWRTDMTTVLNAITAAGRVPILARTTWTGAAGYGGGDYATCGLRYLNDNGVDYLVSTLGVRPGPDLFALFNANGAAYAVTSDPHPNQTGYKAWTNAWADSLGTSELLYGTSTATLAGATSSASGTFTLPTASGSSSLTLAGATSSTNGTVTLPTVSGASSNTLAGATSAASGSTAAGASTATLTGVASVAAGVVGAAGVSATTLAGATSVALGQYGTDAFGVSALALAGATSVAAGAHGVAGASSVTLSGATSAASGTWTAGSVSGASTATLAGATSAANGTFTPALVTGASVASLSGAASAAVGVFGVVTTTFVAGSVILASDGRCGVVLSRGGSMTEDFSIKRGDTLPTLEATSPVPHRIRIL